MRIRVGIYDQDETYVSRMVRYFTTYYIDKIELSVFSEADNFYDFVKYKKIDVALVSSAADYGELALPKNTILAYLSEEPNVDKIGNVRAVYKYQKMENLYREILGIFAELDHNAAYKMADGESPVIIFNGAAGGVGTTTMAIAYARYLADNGKKVLYLNLEDNGVVSPILNGEGNATLSEGLYSVKSGSANLVLKLESMVRKDEYGIYFYEPFSLTLDSAEMTEKDLEECKSVSQIIDFVYKRTIREKIVQPTILYNYPAVLIPLARRNDKDERIIDVFQVVVQGTELCKAYSELVDPITQRKAFEDQLIAKNQGDEETMDLDEGFMLAMEHGMPPISGLGCGLDRLLMLIFNQQSVRDVVLYPLMK